MRFGRKCARFLLAASAGAISIAALASETTTYTYDPLGRLVAAVRSGTVNNGQASSLCYDAAGNRTLYKSSSAGTLATCGAAPPPPPPPPPPNQPPVANADSLTAPKCVYRSKDVIVNDTDTDGHYPLALTAVNQPWAWVESSTSVGMQTPEVNGTYLITYTVADSLGASSNGTLTLTVSGTQQCY